MIVEIEERILDYRQEQLEAWSQGDKRIAPGFVDLPPMVHNQPRYHFAEMLVLRHYHEAQGWKGFASYALGPQYPRSQRRLEGRLKAEEVIPKRGLELLRSLRLDPILKRGGAGEPDLFLYKETGEFRFIEVKKGGDRLREPQLTCIAQILDTLRCEVDIVYVRQEGQHYSPKEYRFDLANHTGRRAEK